MKNLLTYTLILIICTFTIFNNIQNTKLYKNNNKNKNYLLPITPKAVDLKDHYGTEPITSEYGPQAPELSTVNIQREGTLPGQSVSEIDNLNTEIDVNKVASGSLNNIAREAQAIINPNIANPKIKIDADIIHETIVNTPIQLGEKVEEKNIITMDRQTGIISNETVKNKKPIMSVLKTPREVTTKINSVYDLKDKKIIPPMILSKRVKLGIDNV